MRFGLQSKAGAMENHRQVSADITSPAAPSQPNQTRLLSAPRLRHVAQAAAIVSHGIKDPYLIWLHDRALMSRGETYSYAYAIIERHPAEFLIKSVPLALSSLSSLTDAPIVNHNGFLEGPLDELLSISSYLYKWSKFFPICVFIWIGLQVWKRTASLHFVQAMGGIVLLTLYGLIVTTLGGYIYYDRLHTPFLPLLILVVWCTLLTGALLLAQEGPSLLACLTSHYFRRQQVSIPTATILIASLGGVGLLLFMARLLLTHGTSSQVGVVFFFVLSVVSIFRYFRRSTQE